MNFNPLHRTTGRPAILRPIAGVASVWMVAALLAACQTPAQSPATTTVTEAEPALISAPATQAATKPITESTTTTNPVTGTTTVGQAAPASVRLGMTQQRADGNRLAAGRGSLPALTPLDIPLDGPPTWVVAAPLDDGALWVVTLADGTVQAFMVKDGVATPAPITPASLPPGAPPLLAVENGQARLVQPAGASPLTAPVLFGEDGLAFIDEQGALVIQQGGETVTLDVNALPDARILVDERDRLLLLTDPTPRYDHGVLGDGLEAGAIALVETQPAPRVVQTIVIPAPRVVEGIAPLWADLDGDGRREIIVTLSGYETGAQVVAYHEDGTVMATGPAIGQGYRWRHQLAVAPFGPDGETELVDVLTPHIGGVVEFYTLDGNALTVVAQQPGYTSHVINTRNLDMAVAGDFDGDGRVELLLPDQARGQLGAVRHEAGGATVAWTLPVDGQVATNVATVTLADGGLAAGVGRADGVLRVWQP